MDYIVGRRFPVASVTVTPFAVSTSDCNVVAAVTLQGIHLFVSLLACLKTAPRSLAMKCLPHLLVTCTVLSLVGPAASLDFTDKVFDGQPDGILAAFGDFNSDKLTDAFIVDQDLDSFQVFLAHPEAPFLRKEHLACTLRGESISSLMPGDFDGDGAMDVLALTSAGSGRFHAFMAWGALTKLDCPSEPLLRGVRGHPLVVDYNRDMIMDLFGMDSANERTFWLFNTSRAIDRTVKMDGSGRALRLPHSHAYVDLDGDMSADMLLTGQEHFEWWRHSPVGEGFEEVRTIPLPVRGASVTGQSVFVDFNFDGQLDHIVPVCVDSRCKNSSFYLLSNISGDKWLPIECDLKDPAGNLWSFHPPDPSQPYLEAVTARSGDFNLDGYPDLLMTLYCSGNIPKAVLLENVFNEGSSTGRKLVPRWELLSEWNTTSVLASAFYDVQEKGMLDVILVHRNAKGRYQMAAFKSSLDYDANFIKVLVLTGRCYANCSNGRIPFGTNLPGPSISYRTTQSNGELQKAVAAQLPQSAYHSLQLPYTLFGLARSPNFIEFLKVGICSADHEWTQIIPNSQMIIIPTLHGPPSSWLNKLFVTPSRAIVLSAAALAGFGLFLTIVVAVLHCRERRADKREQLAVANRFHFDAM